MPSHRQCSQFKHFAHSNQLIFKSYFEIQHTTDLHHSFSLSLLGLLYDLLPMSSVMDQSLDNFTSKRSFKFSKSIKTQPDVEAQLPFLKVFHSRTPTFFPDLLWLCFSQCCLFRQFWKVKFGKALKLSPP